MGILGYSEGCNECQEYGFSGGGFKNTDFSPQVFGIVLVGLLINKKITFVIFVWAVLSFR